MRTIIYTILIFLSLDIKAQTDSIYIKKTVDDMTDKEYYQTSKRLVCLDKVSNKGFGVNFNITNNNGKLIIDGISVKSANIGSCGEANKLIILLENGDKISLVSWNKFNCDIYSYYDLKASDLEKLGSNKVSKIRFQNGRTYEEYTHEVEEESNSYFITVMQKVKLNQYHLQTKNK